MRGATFALFLCLLSLESLGAGELSPLPINKRCRFELVPSTGPTGNLSPALREKVYGGDNDARVVGDLIYLVQGLMALEISLPRHAHIQWASIFRASVDIFARSIFDKSQLEWEIEEVHSPVALIRVSGTASSWMRFLQTSPIPYRGDVMIPREAVTHLSALYSSLIQQQYSDRLASQLLFRFVFVPRRQSLEGRLALRRAIERRSQAALVAPLVQTLNSFSAPFAVDVVTFFGVMSGLLPLLDDSGDLVQIEDVLMPIDDEVREFDRPKILPYRANGTLKIAN